MFRNKLKAAEHMQDISHPPKKQEKEENKKTAQTDILATTRSDVIDDDSDENGENGTIDWMNHRLKFVKHFEVDYDFLCNQA